MYYYYFNDALPYILHYIKYNSQGMSAISATMYETTPHHQSMYSPSSPSLAYQLSVCQYFVLSSLKIKNYTVWIAPDCHARKLLKSGS